MRYVDSVLELIGDTPLVRLRKVVGDIPGLVLGKIEYLNPGGSGHHHVDGQSRGQRRTIGAAGNLFGFLICEVAHAPTRAASDTHIDARLVDSRLVQAETGRSRICSFLRSQ